VTQLVGHVGQGVLHGMPDGTLAITDDRPNGHAHGLLHAAQQRGQVGVARGQQALGQQDVTRETVADAPQDFVSYVGL
jgi:hypothetical protein